MTSALSHNHDILVGPAHAFGPRDNYGSGVETEVATRHAPINPMPNEPTMWRSTTRNHYMVVDPLDSTYRHNPPVGPAQREINLSKSTEEKRLRTAKSASETTKLVSKSTDMVKPGVRDSEYEELIMKSLERGYLPECRTGSVQHYYNPLRLHPRPGFSSSAARYYCFDGNRNSEPIYSSGLLNPHPMFGKQSDSRKRSEPIYSFGPPADPVSEHKAKESINLFDRMLTKSRETQLKTVHRFDQAAKFGITLRSHEHYGRLNGHNRSQRFQKQY
ncbi:hypothetical protein CYMTET_46974 [Cymbomonas tetramitiformis]|uniref:Uncharacterized protein n=1 Tax=Cymbomonas tetramitiformis TaxID=36881 RepID=A0AAE0EX19_9CHLO|nr:hypothetical protein CYMTET_46975 [Cymbomonas tetramitiformis]KAK3243369.1 hypothetical protein CYMTET_46974 [Cymbomonas tetramitiformis]